MLILPALISFAISERVGPEAKGVKWSSESTTVFASETGGAFYPRLLRLKNGSILCAYDTNEHSKTAFVQLSVSRDEGRSWQVLSKASFGVGNAANGQLIQLPNGDLLCAYRLVNGPTKTLLVSKSADNGKSWQPLSEIVSNTEGVWEPHLLRRPDGELLVFYASEFHRPQAIVLKRSKDDGKTWSAEEIVASHLKSRDGMPVPTVLSNGEILVVFEAQDLDHPFVVRSISSKDGGHTWGERHLVYQPKDRTKRASAPYVERMPNGTLIASFQCDEDKAGTGDAVCDMKTVVSLDNGKTWSLKSAPFFSNRAANWNSLFVLNASTILAATSTNEDGRFKIKIRQGTVQKSK